MNLKQIFPFTVACTLLSIGLTACDNESSSADSTDCTPECTGEQECKDGKCIDKTKTEDSCNPECTGEQECKDGKCVDKAKTEDSCNPECTDGKECVAGECVGSDTDDETQCSPACKDNQICSNGECIDNEEPVVTPDPKAPEFLVTPLEGLVTVQNIVNADFTVVLNKAPTKDVVIPFQNNGEKLGKLSAQKLNFTPDNWNAPQKVTITATTETQKDAQTSYTIVAGPTQSDDKEFNDLKAVEIHVTHHNQYQSTDDVTLKLDKTETKLFMRQVKPKNPSASIENSVTIKAELNKDAKDQNIFWKFENITDDVDYTHLIDVAYDDIQDNGTARTAKITRKEYALNSEANLGEKLDLARTLKVTVSHNSGKSASAVIELKPYLSPGFSYTYLKKNIRDITIKKPISNKNMGDMECGYYDEHTTQVFNQDMMHDYVEPLMYKAKDGKLYPGRASVVAAARFLVTQFPKDIIYTGQNSFDQPKGTTSPYTHASYTWAKHYKESAPDVSNYRIYGLNLTKTAYNSPEFTDKDTTTKEGIPWNCSYEDFYGQKLKKGDKDVEFPYNGLRCTGFVTWAMRNGRFNLGDLFAYTFAQNYPSSPKRRYEDKSKSNYLRGGEIFRDFDNVYEKLTKLKESDFIFLPDLDEKNSAKIKAGDILWYLIYNCEEGKKCPEECKSDGGHFAMVLGIDYDKNKNVNYFYVAEAAGGLGNRLIPHKISSMKTWGKASGKNDVWGKVFNNKEKDACKDRRAIKMDSVYNYYSDQLKESGFEGNTYKYTDMWW